MARDDGQWGMIVPQVSIGLTVFNSERYLEETIESLLAQTYDDFEVIISDNASTDRTREIALDYVARDRRVRYLRNRINIGLAGNFNQAFRLSSGQFFKWAAYDDLCGRDFLRRCVEVLERDPGVVLAHARPVGIDEHGRITRPHASGPDLTSPDPAVRFSRLMHAPFWGTPLFGLVRAQTMSLTGLMGTNAATDHVLLAELSLHGRFCEIVCDEFFNRDHPGRAYTKTSIVTRAEGVDPLVVTRPSILRLRQIASYLAAIRRARVDARTRMRCHGAVGGWLADRAVARTWQALTGGTSAAPRHDRRQQMVFAFNNHEDPKSPGCGSGDAKQSTVLRP
jgi:glycosyltransferase involved in cell wall biosynthesis